MYLVIFTEGPDMLRIFCSYCFWQPSSFRLKKKFNSKALCYNNYSLLCCLRCDLCLADAFSPIKLYQIRCYGYQEAPSYFSFFSHWSQWCQTVQKYRGTWPCDEALSFCRLAGQTECNRGWEWEPSPLRGTSHYAPRPIIPWPAGTIEQEWHIKCWLATIPINTYTRTCS